MEREVADGQQIDVGALEGQQAAVEDAQEDEDIETVDLYY